MEKLPFEGTLLVSDVDGTLLPSNSPIPEENIKAIGRYIELGGKFALATGRSERSAGRYARKIAVNAPCILYNGACIYDFVADKMLYSENLPQQARRMMKLAIGRFPDLGVEVFGGGGCYLLNRNDLTDWHCEHEKFEFIPGDPDGEPKNWIKGLFAGPNERLKELETFVKSLDCRGIEYVFSSPFFFEALPAGITKGSAIRKLAKLLGVSPDRVFAIGDFDNDREMLEEAAVSAVPENASDEMKVLADMVVCSCRDGAVADLIGRLEQMLPSNGG